MDLNMRPQETLPLSFPGSFSKTVTKNVPPRRVSRLVNRFLSTPSGHFFLRNRTFIFKSAVVRFTLVQPNLLNINNESAVIFSAICNTMYVDFMFFLFKAKEASTGDYPLNLSKKIIPSRVIRVFVNTLF